MLDATLARVAAAMERAEARDSWWIIGSAAVALPGVDTSVADVDLLLSPLDAAPLPIEAMAGLEVRADGDWQAVRPRTRVARGGVFVAERAELIDILRLFGREKDLRRATALEHHP